jgi:hypothetical protein
LLKRGESSGKGVCDTISSIHGVAFPLNPEVCLLGNFTKTNLRQSHTIKLTEILLAIAKKCVALKWKLTSDSHIATGREESNFHFKATQNVNLKL